MTLPNVSPKQGLSVEDMIKIHTLVKQYTDQHTSKFIYFMECYDYVKERTLKPLSYNTVAAMLQLMGYRKKRIYAYSA